MQVKGLLLEVLTTLNYSCIFHCKDAKVVRIITKTAFFAPFRDGGNPRLYTFTGSLATQAESFGYFVSKVFFYTRVFAFIFIFLRPKDFKFVYVLK